MMQLRPTNRNVRNVSVIALFAFAVLSMEAFAHLDDNANGGCCVIYPSEEELAEGNVNAAPDKTRRLLAAAPASDLDFVRRKSYVDVLIACDSGAIAMLNTNRKTVEQFAQDSIDRMNSVLANNKLTDTFEFRLAGSVGMTSKFSTVMDGLGIKRGQGGNGVAMAMKEACGADIIACVNSGGGDAIGVAYGLSQTDVTQIANWGVNARNPIASVNVSAALGGYVLSHEIGHVMGAGHSPEEKGPQSFPYSCGRHLTFTNKVDGTRAWYYTVMAYNGARDEEGVKRVYKPIPAYTDSNLYWTPDQDLFDPVKIGTADKFDNANVLRQTCGPVSTWRYHVLPYDDDVVVTDANGNEVLYGRAFASSITLTLASPIEGAKVLYTIDGSTPCSTSPEYTEPITINEATTLTVCSVKDGKAYGPRTIKLVKLGVDPILGQPGIAWYTDTSSPWQYDDSAFALRSAYAAPSWLRAKIAGPKRLSLTYVAKVGADAQFDVWVNGKSQLRVTSDVNFGSASIDLPEGDNDVIFYYRHGGYYENNGVWIAGAALATIAQDEAAVPFAKPAAVWNRDFVDGATRGPVTFNANGNTVSSAGITRIASANGARFDVAGGKRGVHAVVGTTDLLVVGEGSGNAGYNSNNEASTKTILAVTSDQYSNADIGLGVMPASRSTIHFTNDADEGNIWAPDQWPQYGDWPRSGYHTVAFGASADGSFCYRDGDTKLYDDEGRPITGNLTGLCFGSWGDGSRKLMGGTLNYLAVFTNSTISVNDAKNWSLAKMTKALNLSNGGAIPVMELDAATGVNLNGGEYGIASKANVAAVFVQDDTAIDFMSHEASLSGGRVIYVADGKVLTVNVAADTDEIKAVLDATEGEWRHLLIQGAVYGDVAVGVVPDLGSEYALRIEQTETGGIYLVGKYRTVVTSGEEHNGYVFGSKPNAGEADFVVGDASIAINRGADAAGSIVGGHGTAKGETAVINGNASVRIETVLVDNSAAPLDSLANNFVVGGSAYQAGAQSSSSLINGNTSVKIVLPADANGTFVKSIVGASLGGGNDCAPQSQSVGGSSSVSINAPDSVIFSGTIVGGGYMRLPKTAQVGLGVFGASASATVGEGSSVALSGGTYTGVICAGGFKEDDGNWSLYNSNVGVGSTATLTIAGGVFNGATLTGYSPSSNNPSATLAFTGSADLLGEVTISNFDTITIADKAFVKIENAKTREVFAGRDSIRLLEINGVCYATSTLTPTYIQPASNLSYIVAAGEEKRVEAGETISAATFNVQGTLTVAGELYGVSKAIGSGEVAYKGVEPNSGCFEDESWDGTVTLSGIKNRRYFTPDNFGNKFSRVKLSGVSGFFSWTKPYETEVVFEDGPNGYAFNLTGNASTAQFGNVSGDGTILDSSTSTGYQLNYMLFLGTSRFSGSIIADEAEDKGKLIFAFGPNESLMDAFSSLSEGGVYVLDGGHTIIGDEKVWSPKNEIVVMRGGVVEFHGTAKFNAPAKFADGSKLVFDSLAASYGGSSILECTKRLAIPGSAKIEVGFGPGVVSLASDTCIVSWPDGSKVLGEFVPDASARALADSLRIVFSQEADGLWLRAAPFVGDDNSSVGYYAISSDYGTAYVIVTNASETITLDADTGWAEYVSLSENMSLRFEISGDVPPELLYERVNRCGWYAVYEKDGEKVKQDVLSAFMQKGTVSADAYLITLTLTGYQDAEKTIPAYVEVDGERIYVTPEFDIAGDDSPVAIGPEAILPVKTIPGLWYGLTTSTELADGSFDVISDTVKQAVSSSTQLSTESPFEGETRFYRVRVGSSRSALMGQ